MANSLQEQIFSLPLGAELGGDNWESFVYQIGDSWVYKEIKTEHDIDPETPNYKNRHTLQRFWCSDTHFRNVISDQEILQEHLSDWLPETYIVRRQSQFRADYNATVFLQERIEGQLLKEASTQPAGYRRLAEKVEYLTKDVFRAPLDFHNGNLIVQSDTGALFFFDTGTPSNWSYFLDPEKLQTAIDIDTTDAQTFVTFMESLHKIHLDNCLVNKTRS